MLYGSSCLRIFVRISTHSCIFRELVNFACIWTWVSNGAKSFGTKFSASLFAAAIFDRGNERKGWNEGWKREWDCWNYKNRPLPPPILSTYCFPFFLSFWFFSFKHITIAYFPADQKPPLCKHSPLLLVRGLISVGETLERYNLTADPSRTKGKATIIIVLKLHCFIIPQSYISLVGSVCRYLFQFFNSL